MANKNLKSLTFPGLDDKYVIPDIEIDTTLTQTGKAADAGAVGTAVGDLKSALTHFTDVYEYTDYTMTTGSFVNSNTGNITTNANYSYSSMIPCEDIISVYTRLSANIGIAYYDINGNIMTDAGQAPQSTVTDTFYLEKPEGAYYIRFNNQSSNLDNNSIVIYANHPIKANWGDSVKSGITQKELTEKLSKSYTDFTMDEGYYISPTTGAKNQVPYGQHSFASSHIEVDKVNAIYTCMSSVYGMAYYDSNKTFISGLVPFANNTPQWHILEPPQNAKYFRFSCRANANSFVQCRVFYGIGAYTKCVKLEKESPYSDIIGMYDKTIHIGDSLTWSQVWLSDANQRRAYVTYPQTIGKLCNVEASTLAFSGATCKTWWAEYSTRLTEHGLHIVFLGTNGGLTDTIDTDCAGTDPSAFADTNTGCYGKILQTITNNNDKAVLVHVFHNLNNASTTNIVIDKFGARYDFPIIDIDMAERMDLNYHYNPADPTYSNFLHFNDLGYNWLANAIRNKINALSTADKFKISRLQ